MANQATLVRAQMEIGTGKPGYKWVECYEVIQPNGRRIQPYMRNHEAKAYCKKQGWTYVVVNRYPLQG